MISNSSNSSSQDTNQNLIDEKIINEEQNISKDIIERINVVEVNIEEWKTPNIYGLIYMAINDIKNGPYKSLVLKLINESTNEVTKLKTLNNHYNKIMDNNT